MRAAIESDQDRLIHFQPVSVDYCIHDILSVFMRLRLVLWITTVAHWLPKRLEEVDSGGDGKIRMSRVAAKLSKKTCRKNVKQGERLSIWMEKMTQKTLEKPLRGYFPTFPVRLLHPRNSSPPLASFSSRESRSSRSTATRHSDYHRQSQKLSSVSSESSERRQWGFWARAWWLTTESRQFQCRWSRQERAAQSGSPPLARRPSIRPEGRTPRRRSAGVRMGVEACG